jgi:RNA polymerase sigma-70 factor (ECF subfamily)
MGSGTYSPIRQTESEFTAFVEEVQDRLRHTLVARYGWEAGRVAAQEALVYGWEHWERVKDMENPVGYLYRVGSHRAQKLKRSRRRGLFPAPSVATNPWVEPGLPAALDRLSPKQRVSVVLVHGYGLSQREAAAMLGVSPGSVQRHLERGLARLRTELGVNCHD